MAPGASRSASQASFSNSWEADRASTFSSGKVFSSIRRSASQFFSNFASSQKRKSQAKEAPALSEDSAVPLSSPRASPSRKKARIAAPEALGKEESRRLVALLDQRDQPNFGPEMMRKLERERLTATVRSRIVDPAEEMRDDAEIEECLQISQTDRNGPIAEGDGMKLDHENNRPASDMFDLDSAPKQKISETLRNVIHDEDDSRSYLAEHLTNGGLRSEESQRRSTEPSFRSSYLLSPSSRNSGLDASLLAGANQSKDRSFILEEPNLCFPSQARPPPPPVPEAASPGVQRLSRGSDVLDEPFKALDNGADYVGNCLSADAPTVEIFPVEAERMDAERNATDEPRQASPAMSNAVEGELSVQEKVKDDEKQLSPIIEKTVEIGEEKDLVLSPVASRPSLEGPRRFEGSHALTSKSPKNVLEVIDFTADDESEEEERGFFIHRTPERLQFVREPSRGLFRGPLSQAQPERARSGNHSSISGMDMTEASSLIRHMGRVSLGHSTSLNPSPRSNSADTHIHPSDVSFVSNGSRIRAKRLHIRDKEHRQQVQQSRRSLTIASRRDFRPILSEQRKMPIMTSPSSRQHAVEDPQGLASYRQLLARTLGSNALLSTGAKGRSGLQGRSTALSGQKARDSVRQRNFELLLQKSRYAQSKIAVPTSKELLRLRRQEKERERKRRGILGRQPLPLALEPEQEEIVHRALYDPAWKSSVTGASATNRDIAKLRPGEWINDEVITFYMTMINQRSAAAEEARQHPGYDKRWNGIYRTHAFNSHFWAKLDTAGYQSVARWTRRVDIFAKDIILVPCNLGNSHWTCAAINFRRGRIEYYDSMGGRNYRLVEKLRDYLHQEMKDKGKTFQGTAVDIDALDEYYGANTSPQQRNGFDCGIFVCATLEQLSRRDPHYPFDQDPEPEDLDEEAWEDEDLFDTNADDDGDDGSARRDYFGDYRRSRRGRDGYLWNFAQENMPYLRKRIIYEISQRKLLD